MSEHDDNPRDDERVPPQDLVAERAVLGSMLLSRTAIEEAAERVFAPDFYAPAHEEIFAAILDMYGRGEPVDQITTTDELRQRKSLGRIGDSVYLHTLVSQTPIAANAAYYADIVANKAMLRRVVEAGTRTVQWAYEQGATGRDALARSQASLEAVEGPRHGEPYHVIADLLEETISEIEAQEANGEVNGVPTGFADLDELTGGFGAGQMIVVAGRPAMGKSTLALDFCRAASIRHHMTSALFSLEMSRTEVVSRMLSAEARVTLTKLRSGGMSEEDWGRITAHYANIERAPFYVDDSPGLTMTEIRAKCRRLKQRSDLRMVVIDYLQLMSSGQRVESRQVEVSEFSRQIKVLAKELEVPIIALSQLNRGVEQRSSKRPLMSDLRESGSIEQDADIVMLLHREDAYEAESTRPGEADIIVAKHRNGPTRDVTVVAQLHYSRFADLFRDI